MTGYSVFSRHYDRLTDNVDYPSRAAYFQTLIDRHKPGSRRGLLLDLACGTGSLSFALQERGYEVIGVDGSPDMLAVAAAKETPSGGKRPLFLCQTMEALDLYGTVGVTVCALDSLNHLPGEGSLRRVLERVRLFTEPGGLFLFDVNTAYKHRAVLGDNVFVYEPDGLLCLWQNRYDPADGRVDIALDFFEEMADGRYRRETERFSEWVYPPETLEKALEETGFALLGRYGEDTLDPPGETTQRVMYVAERL